ncbi:hypothetical protein RN001_002364 [Aquatica leii]|uniref:Uncharacterized protein n=1 Tax=Aquatica leii TaxID=1421715 RepID=A0AAN7SR74_9COLE|nr:hypothetical protein RN001_002364 [Aquatica leii]
MFCEKNTSLDIKCVSQIGGSNIKDLIRRILAKLVGSRIQFVVMGAVRYHQSGKNITEKEIEIIVATWLSKASERLKRRPRGVQHGTE